MGRVTGRGRWRAGNGVCVTAAAVQAGAQAMSVILATLGAARIQALVGNLCGKGGREEEPDGGDVD